MDLKYLENVVIPQRKKEIENGENLMTRQPIYVVLNLDVRFIYGHVDLLHATNYKSKDREIGYVDDNKDSEDREFSISPDGMQNAIEITRFYVDRIVSFHFTNKSAKEYLKHQSHNLSNPYVYVFYSGYGNVEMDKIFRNE